MARRSQRVRVAALDLELALAAGDEIRTEISAKYRRDRLDDLLAGSGLVLEDWFTDADRRFALALLRRGDLR